MSDLTPTVRQVKKADGTVYQAVRHVKNGKTAKMQSDKKQGWTPPQVAGSNQLSFANIHHSLHERGYSSSNISFAVDIAMNKAGVSATKLNSSSIMSALNDCADALGDREDFGQKDTAVAAERLVIMSLTRLSYGDRVKKLVLNPEIDLQQLISLMKDDGITDPVKLEAVFDGTPKSLLDGIL